MKKMIFLTIMLFLFISLSTASAELKTFVRKHSDQASEADSKLTMRHKAMKELTRSLCEELGSFIESNTEVVNFRLTKDEIKTYSGCYARVKPLEEEWTGKTYWLVAELKVDPDEVIKNIDAVRKDHQRKKALEYQAIQLSKAEDLFSDGLKYVRDNNYDKALTALTASISANPEFYEAYVIRGTLYGNHGQHDLAIQDFNKAISIMPTDPEGYMGRALALTYSAKYYQAIADYDKAIKNDPDYDLAYYHRGQVYFFLKNYTNAVDDFYKAAEINPSTIIELTSNAISNHPQRAYLSYFIRGIAKNKVGDNNGACLDYSEMVKIHKLHATDALTASLRKDPNNCAIYCGRAFASASFGSQNDAITNFKKSLEINPNFSAAYVGLGLSNEFLKQIPEATFSYEKACELGDEYACDRFVVLQQKTVKYEVNNKSAKKNVDIKEQSVKQLEDVDHKKFSAYIAAGDTFMSLGSYDQAISCYNKAIELNPQDGEIYYKRALAFKKGNNQENAIYDMNIAAKLGYKKANCNLNSK